MMKRKRKYIIISGILLCAALAGCGSGNDSMQDEMPETVIMQQEEEIKQTAAESETESENVVRGNRIESQTFDVTLRPIGEVTFASYEPKDEENPLADVVFTIEKNDEIVLQLPGETEDNSNIEQFYQVEAVSFPDYNHDDYDDIIIIISYYLGAGPQAAQPHSVIRYYKGNEDGSFTYEKQMSLDATTSLAEITIQAAKDFIEYTKQTSDEEPGGEQETFQNDKETDGRNLEAWQQAYADYLLNDSDAAAQEGYTLITMSDDEIPQLVEVGIDEATGCRIIYYAKGEVHSAQLNRLYFSYIPGENLLCNSEGLMDTYYDLVYSIVDGEMTLIAAGYYGAEDNSNVQFDAEGNLVYQYEWNGVEMSKEEYEDELFSVYDTSKAVSYDYSSLYSVDEMIEVIEKYLEG